MARLGTGHSNTGETDEANETNEINEVMKIYAVSIYESCWDYNIVHFKKKGTEVSQSVRSHFFFFYNSEPSRLRLFQICSIASISYFNLQL